MEDTGWMMCLASYMPGHLKVRIWMCTCVMCTSTCSPFVHVCMCSTSCPVPAGTAQFVLGKKLGVLCDFENLPHETAQFIKTTQDILDSSAELIFQPPLYKIYSTKAWKKLLISFSASTKYCAPVSFKSITCMYQCPTDCSVLTPFVLDCG